MHCIKTLIFFFKPWIKPFLHLGTCLLLFFRMTSFYMSICMIDNNVNMLLIFIFMVFICSTFTFFWYCKESFNDVFCQHLQLLLILQKFSGLLAGEEIERVILVMVSILIIFLVLQQEPKEENGLQKTNTKQSNRAKCLAKRKIARMFLFLCWEWCRNCSNHRIDASFFIRDFSE